ncbi:hypothetical protein BC828DRAFT_258972, partial [Blastocladiella britannica]
MDSMLQLHSKMRPFCWQLATLALLALALPSALAASTTTTTSTSTTTTTRTGAWGATATGNATNNNATAALDPDEIPGFMFLANPGLKAHGLTMLAMFGLVLPGAAFYARYYRSASPYWMPIHAGVQTFAGLLVLLATIPAWLSAYQCHTPHRWVGVFIMLMVAMQLLGGFAHFRDMTKPRVPKGIVRNGRIHAITGTLILATGFVQMPLGINHDYKFGDPTAMWSPLYLYWYACVLVWAAAIAAMEVSRWQQESRALAQYAPEPNDRAAVGRSSSISDDAHRALVGSAAPSWRDSTTLAASTGSVSGKDAAPLYLKSALAQMVAREARASAIRNGLPVMSWKQLNTSVTDQAKLWVIGPGGVVYDVQRWV